MSTEIIEEVEQHEFSLCKIKEANMEFMGAILNYSQEFLDEKFGEGNANGFVRNAKDGCYEIFAIVNEEGWIS